MGTEDNKGKLLVSEGGEDEIRTHERLSPLPVFETGAFDHSATSPCIFGQETKKL